MGPVPAHPVPLPDGTIHASMHFMSQTTHMPATAASAPGQDMLGLLPVAESGIGALLAPALRLLPILLVL